MDDPEAFTAIFHATEGYRKFEEPKGKNEIRPLARSRVTPVGTKGFFLPLGGS